MLRRATLQHKDHRMSPLHIKLLAGVSPRWPTDAPEKHGLDSAQLKAAGDELVRMRAASAARPPWMPRIDATLNALDGTPQRFVAVPVSHAACMHHHTIM